MITKTRTAIRPHLRNLRLRLALLFFLLVIPVGYYGYYAVPHQLQWAESERTNAYYWEHPGEMARPGAPEVVGANNALRDRLREEEWKYPFFGTLLVLGASAAWTLTGPLADRLVGRGREDVAPAGRWEAA